MSARTQRVDRLIMREYPTGLRTLLEEAGIVEPFHPGVRRELGAVDPEVPARWPSWFRSGRKRSAYVWRSAQRQGALLR
jgi:hypothetical protein